MDYAGRSNVAPKFEVCPGWPVKSYGSCRQQPDIQNSRAIRFEILRMARPCPLRESSASNNRLPTSPPRLSSTREPACPWQQIKVFPLNGLNS